MADAADLDQDIKLQRDSAELIADLGKSLKPFLWKTTRDGRPQIRRRVRIRDLDRLLQLLDQFQELPQLLDPHLDQYVPILADSLLAYLAQPPTRRPASHPQQLILVSRAICKLLYRFCKVRGDKVIVRLFSTETRHLEVLLSALENGTRYSDLEPLSFDIERDLAHEARWQWEETYITLLWLSQLLLAPFDLSTISSDSTMELQTNINGFVCPENVPAIARRAIAVAHRFLSSAGKERDAAKILLVRIALRKDMQTLGVMNALISWAIRSFQTQQEAVDPHRCLGILSFLGNLLASSVGTTSMDSHLHSIFQVMQDISNPELKRFRMINTSPVARKLIIKILRTVSLILLQRFSASELELVGDTIGHLLDSLADQATPVRYAASKALSIIVQRLPNDMAMQVVDEILACFEKNVVSKTGTRERSTTRDLSRVNRFEWHGLALTLSHLVYRHAVPSTYTSAILRALRLALNFEQKSTSGVSVGSNVRDAACFGIWALARRYTTKELEILTIDLDVLNPHLDDRNDSVLQILATDLVVAAALDPEGNVRRGCSAALQELIGRHPDMIEQGIRLVQVVDYHAVALRVRAVEDVALQAARLSEHYHRGLLNSLMSWRGVGDSSVSVRRVAATTIGKLSAVPSDSSLYQDTSHSLSRTSSIADTIISCISGLSSRDFELRHGLTLALAAVVKAFRHELTKTKILNHLRYLATGQSIKTIPSADNAAKSIPICETVHDRFPQITGLKARSSLYALNHSLLRRVFDVLATTKTSLVNARHPQSIADAAAHLIQASWWLLMADCAFRQYGSPRAQEIFNINTWLPNFLQLTLAEQIKLVQVRLKSDYLDILEDGPYSCWSENDTRMAESSPTRTNPQSFRNNACDIFPNSVFVKVACNLLDHFLQLGDPGTAAIGSSTAVDFLLLRNLLHQVAWMSDWAAHGLRLRATGRKAECRAYIQALFRFPFSMTPILSNLFLYTLIDDVNTMWSVASSTTDIEFKVVILESLARSDALRSHSGSFLVLLESALDDYTTNARGDIGSLVRIEAAKAVAVLFSMSFGMTSNIRTFLPKILRIASEKLDRVRLQGMKTLLSHKVDSGSPILLKFPDSVLANPTFSESSRMYFRRLLDLQLEAWFPRVWSRSLMAGYVTSANSGSEDLIRTSRSALSEFCSACPGNFSITISSLTEVVEHNPSNDKLIVPALEVLAFLLDMNLVYLVYTAGFAERLDLWRDVLTMLSATSKQTRNVNKLEAIIKCLGGLCNSRRPKEDAFEGGSNVPLVQLTNFLSHPFPKIRNCAADEIFLRTGKGKGVDWVKTNAHDVNELLIKWLD